MSHGIMRGSFAPAPRPQFSRQNQTQASTPRFDFSTPQAQTMLREATERLNSLNIVHDGWNRFLEGKLLPR